MKDVREWLESIGLAQYANAFEEGEIGWDVLGELDHEVLKELGVNPPGHRLRILKALKDLQTVSESDKNQPQTASTPLQSVEAERRQLTVMFCDLVGSTALSTRTVDG